MGQRCKAYKDDYVNREYLARMEAHKLRCEVRDLREKLKRCRRRSTGLVILRWLRLRCAVSARG